MSVRSADTIPLRIMMEGYAGRALPGWEKVASSATHLRLSRGEHLFDRGQRTPPFTSSGEGS